MRRQTGQPGKLTRTARALLQETSQEHQAGHAAPNLKASYGRLLALQNPQELYEAIGDHGAPGLQRDLRALRGLPPGVILQEMRKRLTNFILEREQLGAVEGAGPLVGVLVEDPIGAISSALEGDTSYCLDRDGARLLEAARRAGLHIQLRTLNEADLLPGDDAQGGDAPGGDIQSGDIQGGDVGDDQTGNVDEYGRHRVTKWEVTGYYHNGEEHYEGEPESLAELRELTMSMLEAIEEGTLHGFQVRGHDSQY